MINSRTETGAQKALNHSNMRSEHLRTAVKVSDLVWRGVYKLQKLLKLAHDLIASLGGDHCGSVPKFTNCCRVSAQGTTTLARSILRQIISHTTKD